MKSEGEEGMLRVDAPPTYLEEERSVSQTVAARSAASTHLVRCASPTS